MEGKPESKRKRIIRELGLTLALAATAYCFFTKSDPYMCLVEFQANQLFNGSYYPKLTLVLVFIIFGFPVLIIEEILVALRKFKTNK